MSKTVIFSVGLAVASASLRGDEARKLQTATHLSGWVLYDQYSDTSCGSTSGNKQASSTTGYALNLCMPLNAAAGVNAGNNVMYTADMSCKTSKIHYF
jgi:hypothetical protein